MAVDSFICGVCSQTFHDMDLFIIHKKSDCSSQPGHQEMLQTERPQQTNSSEDDPLHNQMSAGIDPREVENPSATHVMDDAAQGAVVSGEQTVLAVPDNAYIITTNQELGSERTEQTAIEMVPVEGDISGASQVHVVLRSNSLELTEPAKKPGRKRGRPKKGQGKKPEEPASTRETTKPTEAKSKLPEKGADGKLHCSCCKKSFLKERHFLTHKCLASSDYVDISKREVMKMEMGDTEAELPGDEGDEDEDEDYDADDTAEFRVPKTPNKKLRTSKLKAEQKAESSVEGSSETEPSKEERTESDDVTNKEDTSASPVQLMTSIDQVADVPVFNNEEDKMAFEDSLNVDLSGIDHMFKTHVIEQDVNEKAPPPASRTSNELCIYSCNTCDKVFKTVSHMRLHCLTHTNLKPFKCIHCSYTSNSKGNLYTHMRKHTGQFYRCGVCSFKTVNKSHLVEHEAIHSGIKHKCNICLKDYNTIKSLINHVRKYHSQNKKGKAYLDAFQGKHSKGIAVLHQCHVCNRKFKKKIDRDRHLFVHNIRDNPNIFFCDLCTYSASRRVYLDKHFRKHRVVYRCTECPEKFLSTIKLSQHLQNDHQVGFTDGRWDTLFESCINNSLYLPEPDGSIDNLDEGLVEYVNAGAAAGEDDAEEPEEDEQTSEKNGVKDADNLKKEQDKEVATGGSTEAATESKSQSDQSASNDPSSEDQQMLLMTTEQVDKVSEPNVSVNPESAQQTLLITVEQDDKVSDPNVSVTPGNTDDPSSVQAFSETDNSDAAANVEETAEAPPDSGDIYRRLEFKQMSLDVLQKLRTMFGSEECEYCGRLFYSKTDFEPHFRTHTGEKPFECDQCEYRAATKDNLKRHVEREHEHIKYVCRECNFVANTRTQLWNHEQKHKEPVEIECPECKAKFVGKRRLKAHMMFKHPNVKLNEKLSENSGTQKPAGKLGRKSYQCPYCDRTFLRAHSDLEKHMWIHEGIKPFRCPLCPHACRSKNNLAAHMLRHSPDKPFTCQECGKGYKSKTALRWHVRSHKDGKMFKCHRCPYEAVQRSHLKRHMETHDIIKKFMCEICDYSANTLGYMKIHYTRNHKGHVYTHNPHIKKTTNVEARVYKCLSCDYLFGNLSDMKRHLKIRHNIQVEDIHSLETTSEQPVDVNEVSGGTQYLPVEGATQQVTDGQVQLVQMAVNDLPVTEEHPASEMHTLHYSVPGQMTVDQKAVNIIQQIIDMQNQGAFNQQQITVQSDDGQSLVAVNPDTIILQQEGEEVVVASSSGEPMNENQYVIQYVSPDGQIIQEPASNHPQFLQTVTAQSGQHLTETVQDIMQENQIVETTNHIPDDCDQVLETSNQMDGDSAQIMEIPNHMDVNNDHVIEASSRLSDSNEQIIETSTHIINDNSQQQMMDITNISHEHVVMDPSNSVTHVDVVSSQMIETTTEGQTLHHPIISQQGLETQMVETSMVVEDSQQMALPDGSENMAP